ncbi:hypothetical protein RM697_01195 [Ichthyenterobacterium sp. W332]|uniref:Uncharacterized protein n=1 Tax=Microcosmobacter mediterraneus TaxID=3075607 RepID=A0ABU2YGD7_9FLAO|nr:hypothetical protein [Ichthyenterobacterium sp. W332]MDT0557241.1 hypothetical protein [Ichthyenterobacterium sp. W332]
MKKPYIELRTRNTFGDIIDNYFQFLKRNFQAYTNLYLRYNALSILLALGASYLLVTGFMGLASRDFRFGMTEDTNNEFYFGIGVAVLLFTVFITSAINYSFSSAYISEYVNAKGDVKARNIWSSIKKKFWSIVVLILLGAVIYVVYLIISTVAAIVPFLGYIFRFALSFLVSGLFGLTFMALFVGRNQIGEAISDGWNFTFSNFLKVMLFALVIGILNFLITLVIISIPSYIIGFYIYFSAESEIEIFTSGFAKVLFTFGFAIYILAFIYSQALTQLAFGVLFYNLHEEKHNTFLQQKIEQIGVDE